jgi:hypothetical protein
MATSVDKLQMPKITLKQYESGTNSTFMSGADKTSKINNLIFIKKQPFEEELRPALSSRFVETPDANQFHLLFRLAKGMTDITETESTRGNSVVDRKMYNAAVLDDVTSRNIANLIACIARACFGNDPYTSPLRENELTFRSAKVFIV